MAGPLGSIQPASGSPEHVYPSAEPAEDRGQITGWEDAQRSFSQLLSGLAEGTAVAWSLVLSG